MRTYPYELTPLNGRKSFYGKALVFEGQNINGLHYEVLQSYRTEIIRRYDNGSFEALAEPELITCTTAAHLKSFCGLTKKDYVKLWNKMLKGDTKVYRTKQECENDNQVKVITF